MLTLGLLIESGLVYLVCSKPTEFNMASKSGAEEVFEEEDATELKFGKGH